MIVTNEHESPHRGETTYEADSFGTVQFSRVHCQPAVRLFGSNVGQGELIALRINKASITRGLSHDFVFGHTELIEVYLTPMQFAELLTSLNQGTGVCCTIRHHNGKSIEHEHVPTKSEHFKEKVANSIKDALGTIESLGKAVDSIVEQGKPVSVRQAKELKEMVARFDRDIQSNLPYIMAQFTKTMDKIVTESKSAVEAYVDHVVHKTGIQGLKANAPRILELSSGDDVVPSVD